jgi:hypothetical protein
MPQDATLSHTKWDCKYHVVFIPKYHRQALSKERRQHLGDKPRHDRLYWLIPKHSEQLPRA